jgi:hypothetical protein
MSDPDKAPGGAVLAALTVSFLSLMSGAVAPAIGDWSQEKNVTQSDTMAVVGTLSFSRAPANQYLHLVAREQSVDWTFQMHRYLSVHYTGGPLGWVRDSVIVDSTEAEAGWCQTTDDANAVVDRYGRLHFVTEIRPEVWTDGVHEFKEKVAITYAVLDSCAAPDEVCYLFGMDCPCKDCNPSIFLQERDGPSGPEDVLHVMFDRGDVGVAGYDCTPERGTYYTRLSVGEEFDVTGWWPPSVVYRPREMESVRGEDVPGGGGRIVVDSDDVVHFMRRIKGDSTAIKPDSILHVWGTPPDSAAGGEWQDVQEECVSCLVSGWGVVSAGPSMVLGAGGKIHAAWHTMVDVEGVEQREVFFATLDDTDWSVPIRLSEEAPMDTASVFPVLSVTASGAIHVVWSSPKAYGMLTNDPPEQSGVQVFHRMCWSGDPGDISNWSPVTRVSSGTQWDGQWPVVVAFPDSVGYVIWCQHEETSENWGLLDWDVHFAYLEEGDIVGVDGIGVPDPGRPRIERIGPNPSLGAMQIKYVLPSSVTGTVPVRASLYDVTGRVVRDLVRGNHAPGVYDVGWDGTDNRGTPVSAGVYFLKFEAGDLKQTKKIVLLR